MVLRQTAAQDCDLIATQPLPLQLQFTMRGARKSRRRLHVFSSPRPPLFRLPAGPRLLDIVEAVTLGVETSARWALADAWTVSGNYTYTESEQKSGTRAGLPLTDTPEHMVNASLSWQATDRLSTWLRGESRSERFRGVGAERDALGDYKAYSLFHLGGAYELNDRVTLNAVIYNLLDTDFVSLLPYGNPVAYGAEYTNNQEPRRLWISARVDF